MKLKLEAKTLKGTITVPSSKSAAHRALICAALAEGISHLQNIGTSKDIEATIGALRSLGVQIVRSPADTSVQGGALAQQAELFCGESGSTLRFLLPVALVGGGSFHFMGEGRLMHRPMEEYFHIFEQDGIQYAREDNSFTAQGRLRGGDYTVQGNISSQYITGLLLALPLAERDSTVTVLGDFESRSYVEMTLAVQRNFGIEIGQQEHIYYIKGRQKYNACAMTIEGDYSQAAFWLAANALGSDIKLQGLEQESAQGDRQIINLLQRAGCESIFQQNTLCSKGTAQLSIRADVSDCPDLVPILAVLCCALKGKSEITNAARLRLKESDRLSAVTAELRKLGADIEELPDALVIQGGRKLQGATVESHNDHRIAMALAIAALLCDGAIVLDDAECIAKSYPDFWEHYRELGGKADECSMG